MQLPLNLSLTESEQLLRRSGYKTIKNPHTQQWSFIKTTGRTHYPRFHAHLIVKNKLVILDLHFDALRPQHKKTASASENDGPVVERELNLIRSKIRKTVVETTPQTPKKSQTPKRSFWNLFKKN